MNINRIDDIASITSLLLSTQIFSKVEIISKQSTLNTLTAIFIQRKIYYKLAGTFLQYFSRISKIYAGVNVNIISKTFNVIMMSASQNLISLHLVTCAKLSLLQIIFDWDLGIRVSNEIFTNKMTKSVVDDRSSFISARGVRQHIRYILFAIGNFTSSENKTVCWNPVVLAAIIFQKRWFADKNITVRDNLLELLTYISAYI